MNTKIAIERPWRFLLALVSLHIFLWTLVPALVRTVLPLDTIEGLTWGHEWQWGYDKNPYLNAWVSEIFSYVGGASGWTLYLASALCVGACFWAIYQLAKKFFTPMQAVSCAFLLEGIYYLTISAPQFNDNMLELALWPLSALFFYNALTQQRYRDWLLLGLLLGLSFMTKYLVIILMLPMLLFVFFNPRARLSFKKVGLYLSLLPFLLVTTPHVVWLFHHDFITINYAFNRAEQASHWSNHFFFAVKFVAEQLLAFLPSVLLSLWFIGSRDKQQRLSHFNQQFLLFVCAGPFIALALLSMIKGYVLVSMWGVPLLPPLTLIVVALWQPSIHRFRFLGLFYSACVLLLLVTTAYAISVLYSPFSSTCKATAYYPGREIAQRVTELWHNHYETPLSYVAGPRWEAGNVAFYSSDRPHVFMESNLSVSPWINEQDFRTKGAVFIWQLNKKTDIRQLSSLQHRFGAIQVLAPEIFMQGACEIQIGIGLLPPMQ